MSVKIGGLVFGVTEILNASFGAFSAFPAAMLGRPRALSGVIPAQSRKAKNVVELAADS